MSEPFSDVLIVGAGQAAAQLALALRQGGFTDTLRILGDEPDPPYERPPLSKDYLTGERSAERLLLRPLEFWAQREVQLERGRRVTTVDAQGHRVTCADGSAWRYRWLVWATGGRARTLSLPGGELDGIFTIRTRADVDRLRAALPDLSSVAIIGAGYIGLEVAPALLKAGKTVTVIEAQPRVLARVAGPELSGYMKGVHEAHGVRFRLGVQVEALQASHGRVTGVSFVDASEAVSCDGLIAAVGIVPCVEALAAAGASIGNGVEVDSFCQTNLPDVFAIGDCANHVSAWADNARVRLESVPNAVEQAKTVASVLLDRPEPYRALPWFWSNQYDVRIQTVGLSIGHDARVLRGRLEDGSFSVIYLRQGQVIALDCVNAPRDFTQGRALVENHLVAPPAALADTGIALRSLLQTYSAKD